MALTKEVKQELIGKHGRKISETIGEGVAFQYFGAHAEDDALDARLLGLLGDRLQRFVERQSRMNERCELTREKREIAGRDTAAKADLGRAATLLGMRDLVDGNRQQALFPQRLADVASGVAFENAFALATAGIDGGVFESAHQSSRVTRRTSSIVVTPERILARPSSRMLGVIERA